MIFIGVRYIKLFQLRLSDPTQAYATRPKGSVVSCKSDHRQPKLTPREREEFINYLWFSSRDVTFERDLYWVASGRQQFETLYGE